MGMSNREIAALEREARSREDLAKAINSNKGKEYEKERKALEKVLGGKKKLDEADSILMEAKKVYEKEIQKGKAEAEALLRKSRERIAIEIETLTEKQRVLDMEIRRTAAQRTALSVRAQELEDRASSLQKQEAENSAREHDLDVRESNVRTREEGVKQREMNIMRFDDWAKARPA